MLKNKFAIVMLGASFLLCSLVGAAAEPPAAADKDRLADYLSQIYSLPLTQTGAVTHGKPEHNLAAFLRSDHSRFKSGEVMLLSYGLVHPYLRLGIQSEPNPPAKPVRIIRPDNAADPNNRSWFSVTDADGRALPYKGELVKRMTVQADDSMALTQGEFSGTNSSEIILQFNFEKTRQVPTAVALCVGRIARHLGRRDRFE